MLEAVIKLGVGFALGIAQGTVLLEACRTHSIPLQFF